MQTFLKGSVVCLMLLFSVACGKHKQTESAQTMKIEAKPNVTTLYYSGFVKPIQTFPVNEVQADGTIMKKGFDYGKTVQKNQLLFIVNSPQLTKNYQEALSTYLKSKKNYADVQFQMTGAIALKKLEILSEQEFLNTQSQLFNSELDLEQSTRRLKEVLQDLGVPFTSVSELQSTNVKAITEALNKAPSTVNIYSPATGIVLLPEDSGASKEASKAPLTVGTQVKAGQTLILVGDMTGISVNIKVTEIYIDKIKEGQEAIVTSEAFPGITLKGKVTLVGRQSSSDNSSGSVPTFSVSVVVPNMTKEALNKIRVGMSADVALPLTTPATISVPLSAVITREGKSYIQIIDSKTGKPKEVPVETGRTSVDSVEIMKGLKNGDEVVINAAATATTTH